MKTKYLLGDGWKSLPEWFKQRYNHSPALQEAFRYGASNDMEDTETLWLALKIIDEYAESWRCALVESNRREICVPSDWLLSQLEKPENRAAINASGWDADKLFLIAKTTSKSKPKQKIYSL